MSYSRITKCRVCGNTELVEVMDLGIQALTGVFPDSEKADVPEMPLILVKCHGSDWCCNLLQLAHTYDLNQMYGDNYGYRSGLNTQMEKHLQESVQGIQSIVELTDSDLILDIGSNDGTALSFYPEHVGTLVGIDPTGEKFAKYYPAKAKVISDFFSKPLFVAHCGKRKAKVVTSFSMFYDLCNPVQFAKEVADILDAQGVWVLEQSYMPTMLKMCSYDTVCHEHLEYYGLSQIKWIMDQANLDIIDVSFNDTNGGSFVVTVAHPGFAGKKQYAMVEKVLQQEAQYQSLSPFVDFALQCENQREQLKTRLLNDKNQGKRVAAIGASTKGNVILQYCGIDSSLVYAIGEVNEDKFGKYTPKTLIPIEPEQAILEQKPDYLLVLPWHFRRFFEQSSDFAAYNLIYPINNT